MSRIIMAEPLNLTGLLRDARDLIRRYAPARSAEADRVATGLHRLANMIDIEVSNAKTARPTRIA